MTRASEPGADTAPTNIAARLAARAEAHPDRPALVEGSGRRRRAATFRELADRVARVGGRLRRRGVEPGDRVLLAIPMSVDLYAGLLGVLHAGAVAVFVDAWAGRRRLDQAVAAAAPRAFLGTPRAHLLRLMSPALRRVPIRLWAGPTPLGAPRLGPSGSGRRGTAAAAAPLPPEAPALITFTTGTTGRPKAAVRSHGFLWAQHRVLAHHLGLTEGDIDMPTLPVFVLNNLALGVASVIPDFDPRRPAEVDPDAILDQMRREGVTTTSGSPAFYARLAERGDGIPVRALFTGGAPVFPPLAHRLQQATRGTVTVMYGSTEAEPISAIGARELVEAGDAGEALGVCAGRPVPEIDWKLIRPSDGPVTLSNGGWATLEVADGETGELVVAGDHVLEGYLDDPINEARSKIREGARVWHRTGDGARYDGDRLWLMGRVSERVERDGRTWWGMAAEARALTVEGVAHAAYLGWPDPGSGTKALLCVELDAAAPGGPGTHLPDDLADRLRQALDPIPVDDLIRLPAIPRDPRHASKTDPGALRETLAALGLPG